MNGKQDLVLSPDPTSKRKRGSGNYSTSLHSGLAVGVDFVKPLKLLVGLWLIGIVIHKLVGV